MKIYFSTSISNCISTETKICGRNKLDTNITFQKFIGKNNAELQENQSKSFKNRKLFSLLSLNDWTYVPSLK